MSSTNSKKEESINPVTTMIPVEYVSRLVWDKKLGERLKLLRTTKKISRRALAESLKAIGQDYSHQYLQQIEEADKVETVSMALVLSICHIVGISLGQLMPLVTFEQPKNILLVRLDTPDTDC